MATCAGAAELKVETFEGIGQRPTLDADDEKPADTHIAVGHGKAADGRVIEVTNNGVQIFDKLTSTVAEAISLEAFANAPENTCFDPKIIYDNQNRRFTIVMSESKAAEKSRLHVITSITHTPNNLASDWVRIVADAGTNIGGTATWFDYPCPGVSADRLYVTGNMKDNNGYHKGTVIRSYSKAELLESEPSHHDLVLDAATSKGTFVVQPVHQAQQSGEMRFVSRCSPHEIRVLAIGSEGGTPRITNDNLVKCDGGLQLRTGAAQTGSSGIRLATSSGRIMQAVEAAGSIWSVQTADRDRDGCEEVNWFRLEQAGQTYEVESQGSIPGSTTENWTYLPSIAVTAEGTPGITYTESGTSTPVTPRFAHLHNEKAVQAVVLQESAGAYDGHEPHNPEKWGDYSATVLDPEDGGTFWCATDYVKKARLAGDDAEWGTVIARVSVTTASIDQTRLRKQEGDMKQNSLMVIAPYWADGTWVFDDEKVGLVKEPFVQGIPDMIDAIVANIPDARRGFRLLFSRDPFPGYQAKLDWQREEMGGNWYRWKDKKAEGWLCPALFKYFEQAPESIYCKAEPLKK